MSNLTTTLDHARSLDASDPSPARGAVEFPRPHVASSVAYFAGNSLGLMPRSAREAISQRLDEWSSAGVAGHFTGDSPWTEAATSLAAPMARIVGANPHEVVVMNTLTVNLHLLMAAFYRPTATRNTIVIEGGAFPSDDYAVASQARLHRLDPRDTIHRLVSDTRGMFSTERVIAEIAAHANETALVLLGGINFRTGQLLDIPKITAAVREMGIPIIWDLAHAAGNVELALHDWGVDAAAWCTYKYLNAGPGAIAALFVHERHHSRSDLAILDGWWGNDPKTRFEMTEAIQPDQGAARWQISNPPILGLATIAPALEQFDAAGGMKVLRARSLRLTAFLESLLDQVTSSHRVEQLTSRDPSARGAQISVLVDDAKTITERLIHEFDVVPDDRPPNIVRFAPAPLYNSYEDCWRAVDALAQVVGKY